MITHTGDDANKALTQLIASSEYTQKWVTLNVVIHAHVDEPTKTITFTLTPANEGYFGAVMSTITGFGVTSAISTVAFAFVGYFVPMAVFGVLAVGSLVGHYVIARGVYLDIYRR